MDNKNTNYSRRSFLTTAAAGLAGVGMTGLVPGKIFAQEKEKPVEKEGKKIIYRQLGKTDIRVPIISMGVMNSNVPQIVQASYEAGVRHFDTAAAYQYGRNEQMVGKVIDQLKARDKVIIGTKVGHPGRPNLSRAEITEKFINVFEGSLSRLKTNFVDILYLHSVSSREEVNDPAIIDAMKIIKEKKLARYVGVSTHSNMAEVIDEVSGQGFYEVVLTAINFTMVDDSALLTAIKNAAAKGVGIVAMKTMAGGSRWPNPETRREYGSTTIARACLKWVMRNENIATCIPGYTNFEHMKDDFSVAYDLEYTAEEKKFLSDNDIKLSMGFCRQCRTCLASCPRNVEIPTLMRIHMYAAQYGNFVLARQTLDDIPSENGLKNCTACSSCTAGCAHTIDIAGRIEELKLMYA
ncbi:MAG: aldo/keto reductase [candidate division Zixibacteria bacterium]|nr:aldo/keto reductase [candidate division Zixibacteria bacterium]